MSGDNLTLETHHFSYKGKFLKSRRDRPAELDTQFIDADGFMRNLLKMYWEFVWVYLIIKQDKVGHGGLLNEIFVNNPQLVMRHANYALWHTILYGAALGLLTTLAVHLITNFM